MTNPHRFADPADPVDPAESDPIMSPPCVLVFNANDPSGAAGLACDVMSVASVGAHALPVITGTYIRDTSKIFDFYPLDEEAVTDQARAILEDAPVHVIKVGFAGSPENISAIAELASDYAELPLIACMPDLSWWEEDKIDQYQDAFRELLLPQTTVLVGNHSTLRRWLLPDWSGNKNPSPRDLARAAADMGTPYTLVTGIQLPEQFVDNVLATPQAVLASEKFERFDVLFAGSGDTLSAALAAVIAAGSDLPAAVSEALQYLDHCLEAGFRPGMGLAVPDRLFWAQPEDDEDDAAADHEGRIPDFLQVSFNETKH
jgi:hydroxymethylpyrimidine/phosphomethylpyrimidine kinase